MMVLIFLVKSHEVENLLINLFINLNIAVTRESIISIIQNILQ